MKELTTKHRAISRRSFLAGLAAIPLAAPRPRRPYRFRPGRGSVIDINGRVIIPPEFDFVGSVSEGLAVVSVSIDGKTRRGKRLQGAIDKNRKMVIRPSFESLSEFREGFAVASQGTDKFFVDRTGARAQITNLPACWGFRDGLAIVGPAGQRVYVDKNGRIVAPFDKVGI